VGRSSNREQILDAFQWLIVERGTGNVSLDETAERAGVSKGGLLYHFPAKTDLFAALADRLARAIDAAIVQAPTEPSALIRWYLTAAIDNTHADNTLWRSLLAATHAVDDAFADSLVELFARFAGPLRVLAPSLAEHVRLVSDGLYINALLGSPPLPADHLEQIIAVLIAQV